MEAAAMVASAAAEAARDAALSASVAAAAAAKDAAVAAANAREATDAAKEAAAAVSAAALKAEEAAAMASAAALNAKEAADVAVTAGKAASAAAAAAAIRASKKCKFAAVVLNAVETVPVAVTAGEAAVGAVALNAMETAPVVVAAASAVESAPVAVAAGEAVVAAVALNAMEKAPVVVAAGEAAAAAAAALLAFKKSKFHINDVEQDPQGSRDVDDDVNTVDLISHLLDAVLCSIVSLLPTKEAARTQVISRRWRPLWRSAPLNLLADHELTSKDHTFVDLISKILSVHPGPACRLSLCLSIRDYNGKIKGWLTSQALDKLQEFELNPDRRLGLRGKLYPLPSSVCRFAPTLRVAKFGGCCFSKLIAMLSLKFPCLKQLTLDRVAISEDALQDMLSGCSALESLELKNNFGFARLCISSRTLKSIGFCASWRRKSVLLKEMVIKDTPCLERFLQLHQPYVLPTIRVISAPKLKIVGLLSNNIAELQLGTSIFQKMTAVSLTTKMHTMRVLFLVSVGPRLDVVVNFLKCFPCLERLYVVIFQSLPHPGRVVDNVRKYDPLDPIECLELHLKKVELKNYDGTQSLSVDFAKFFVLNVKVLKEMKITLPYHRQHDWFANQHELLQIKDRASRDAQLDLKCGSKAWFTHNRDTHDLSTDDPFDMPSSGCSQCS